jgi:IS1 family transposase
MANVLAADKQRMVLNLLVEGSSLRAVERLTGVQKKTATRLLVRFGQACRQFLDEEMRGLTLRHIQCDEIQTYVAKRQKNLTIEEKEHCPQIGEFYLWTAIDMDTKLVPTFVIGKRSGDMARRLMMDLAKRLNMPRPQDWLSATYEKVVQVSTDGFIAYPEAVDMAFGPYVKFGTIIKTYRNADRAPGNYSPAEIIEVKRKARFGMDESEMDTICTSHVERHNLTLRTFLKRFNRLTICFSKKLDNLAAAVALYMAYYNFCWRPRYQDWSGKAGRLRPTPAMMAGVTARLWSFEDLFAEVRARHLEW